MEHLTIPRTSVDAFYEYAAPYRRISLKIKSAGLKEIGLPITDKVLLGIVASLDIPHDERIWRSIFIAKELTGEHLQVLHSEEARRAISRGRFMFPDEIRNFCKRRFGIEKTKYHLTGNRREAAVKFTEDTRPEMWKFDGVTVPPYFPLDISFHGWKYHHDWDLRSLGNSFSLVLPEVEEGLKI